MRRLTAKREHAVESAAPVAVPFRLTTAGRHVPPKIRAAAAVHAHAEAVLIPPLRRFVRDARAVGVSEFGIVQQLRRSPRPGPAAQAFVSLAVVSHECC